MEKFVLGLLLMPMLVLCSGAPAGAQQATRQQAEFPVADEKPSEVLVKEEPPADGGRVRFDVGAKVASQYISRGVAFSEEPSLQPYITMTVALPELAGGVVRDVSWFVGNWSSLQSGGPGLGQRNSGDLAGWYEADLYTGISLGLPNDLNFSFTYYYYHSPAHSFRGYSDLEWILSYDDTGRWEGIVPLRDFTLSPMLRITQEVGRPGRKDAFYVQPSLTPSFNIGKADNPVWVRVPLAIGLSDDYYTTSNGGTATFGYFRTGLTIAGSFFRLGANPFMVGGGVDFWVLNDKVANGLDGTELVWRAGFRWAF
ncbi:MAG TPA: hypothetical protein VIG90_13190 [Pedomonas sp.]|uniref:hypothetical protein n=1 Tax=Pedomonas sp. TaxID=2976421 RepID=UPI002F41A885